MLKSVRYWLSTGCVALALSVGVQAEETWYDDDDHAMASSGSVSDPFEKVNRVTFAFNDFLDTWILQPAAKGYTYITPDPIEDMVSNFFQNLGEVRNVANALLQFKLQDAASSTTRFLVNSTIGLFGVVDVGSAMGLEYRYNDFGMTLANWYVPQGPYLVVPLLGPKTVRSAVGIVPDAGLDPINYINPEKDRIAMSAASLVDLRANLLEQEGLIVGDKYTFIRDAYLQRRAFLTSEDGYIEDDF